jgi:hypothetical protein
MSLPKFPAKSITFRDKSFPLLQTRAFSSLSVDTVNAINMITLDSRFPPNIVGSFKYVVHEYPADIDMFESYQSHAIREAPEKNSNGCSYKEAIKDIASKFKDIALRLKEGKDVYLGDFKAGHDNRYRVNIGYIRNLKLANYNPFLIRSNIIKIGEQGLYSEAEVSELLSKVIEQPSLQEYSDLENAIRKRYIIRWTLDELLNGFKILPLNVKLTLEEAIGHKSIIKIDIWLYLNQRYIEMTNWYMLTYKDNQGVIKNLSIKPEKYESSLIKDLYHYNNPAVNKYMKLAKRLWLYAVLKKNKQLMISLYPLFGSGASKMYQIVGEIETIQNILEKVKKVSLDTIITNIEDWKTRLGTVMSDILPIPVAHVVYENINIILKNKHKKEFILVKLDEISDKLTQYINRYVKLYFSRNHIKLEKFLEIK